MFFVVLASKPLQRDFDGAFQGFQISVDDVPDDLRINGIIFMPQSVSDRPNLRPWLIRYQLKNAGKPLSLRGIMGHITSYLSEGPIQELRRLLIECQFQ